MKLYQNHHKYLSEVHNVCTEEINKITLSNHDDKRLETFDKITSDPYGKSVGKATKTEFSEFSA